MIHTPQATKTGIVIGGAYVPSRTPRYADPIEFYRRENRARRVGRALLGLGLFALLGVLLAWRM